MVRIFRHFWLWISLAAVTLTAGTTGTAEEATLVFINGKPSPVFFNDGDSFRVLAGPYSGTKTRLAGFNTLESSGPVQKFGTWTLKEQYAIAKMATHNARKGIWHCTSNMDHDGYGRVLMVCRDLVIDQLKHGYAHALTITKDPAPKIYLDAQREAMHFRRGIWAHGVPPFIVTSVHSFSDGYGIKTYNRVVSTVDGHSEKWHHRSRYKECELACFQAKQLSLPEAFDVVRELRADPGAGKVIAGVDDILVAAAVNNFVASGVVPALVNHDRQGPLVQKLEQMKNNSRFANAQETKIACMIYVNFKRWYDSPKPTCLKW